MSRPDGDGEGLRHPPCPHPQHWPAAPAAEAELRANDVAVEDVRQILAAIGLGTHARPYSAHDVVQREVLPALRGLVEQAAEAARLRAVVARVEALLAEQAPYEWNGTVHVVALRRALDGEGT